MGQPLDQWLSYLVQSIIHWTKRLIHSAAKIIARTGEEEGKPLSSAKITKIPARARSLTIVWLIFGFGSADHEDRESQNRLVNTGLIPNLPASVKNFATCFVGDSIRWGYNPSLSERRSLILVGPLVMVSKKLTIEEMQFADAYLDLANPEAHHWAFDILVSADTREEKLNLVMSVIQRAHLPGGRGSSGLTRCRLHGGSHE